MAILKPDGTLSGRIGNVVFQYQKGKQTMRQRPASYRDKMTDVQIMQRQKMKEAQRLYRLLKDVAKGCFEFKKVNQRDCDCFMSANILDLGTVSQGTLPPLEYHFSEGQLVLCLKPEEWKKGDVLRFVGIEDGEVKTTDKTAEFPMQSTITVDVVEGGQYCWIHIRHDRKYTHVSTQKLCQNTRESLS